MVPQFEIRNPNKPTFKRKFEEYSDEKLNKHLSTIADNINQEYCQPGEKKLVKRRLINVPRFFLLMERDDLDKLLSRMPSDFNVSPTEIKKIYLGN